MNNDLLIRCSKAFTERRFEDALSYSNQLLRFGRTPHHYFNHASILEELNRFEEMVQALKTARELKPNCPVIRYFLSEALLKNGNFREAFTEGEWRFTLPLEDSYAPNPLVFSLRPKVRQMYSKPYWNGEDGRLLVFNEAGYGDFIQYIRYLPRLKAEVILEVKTELYRLFKSMGNVIVRDKEDKLNSWYSTFSEDQKEIPLPEHDYVMSINSICHFLDPDLTDIPLKPYLFASKAGNPTIESFGGKFKIGICWAGNHDHDNDCYRSMFVKEFKPLAEIEGVQLFSLQKGKMVRHWLDRGRVDLLEDCDFGVVDLSEGLTDFQNTAEVIKDLDLVISVDTATAHLAGAIGHPVWLLVSGVKPDWRWQLNWYPSMRVWRQQGAWSELMSRMAEEIKILLDNRQNRE